MQSWNATATAPRASQYDVDLVFTTREHGHFMLETVTKFGNNEGSAAASHWLTAQCIQQRGDAHGEHLVRHASFALSPHPPTCPQKMSSNGHVPDGEGDSSPAISPHITDPVYPDPLEKVCMYPLLLSWIFALGGSVADGAEAHREDDHHVTHMHTITVKQSLSRAMGGFLLQRLSSVRSVLPNGGGGTDTMLISVSVAAATVELAEVTEVPPLTVVHALGALHHRQSKSSIALMNKPGWATRANNFIKFRQKSKILLVDGAVPQTLLPDTLHPLCIKRTHIRKSAQTGFDYYHPLSTHFLKASNLFKNTQARPHLGMLFKVASNSQTLKLVKARFHFKSLKRHPKAAVKPDSSFKLFSPRNFIHVYCWEGTAVPQAIWSWVNGVYRWREVGAEWNTQQMQT
ncbi:hypothetical protein K438DRAFT_2092022 [Mycena galopus ATCC 62051]|nr:hypothetical protein K438DRAFT_2092022 [Mycena galopus ATCC 62051]